MIDNAQILAVIHNHLVHKLTLDIHTQHLSVHQH